MRGLRSDVTNLGTEELQNLIVIANDTRDNTLELEQPSIAENRSLNWVFRWQLCPLTVIPFVRDFALAANGSYGGLRRSIAKLRLSSGLGC